MKKILILCTGNSCRSQIAEGWMRYFSEKEAEIYSAGIKPHGVNQTAVNVMKECEIDISNQTSDSIDKYVNVKFDFVITVCDNAKEMCPVFPGESIKIHKSFEDPSDFSGSENEILIRFRQVRDQIKQFCLEFVNKNIKKINSL